MNNPETDDTEDDDDSETAASDESFKDRALDKLHDLGRSEVSDWADKSEIGSRLAEFGIGKSDKQGDEKDDDKSESDDDSSDDDE